MGRLAKLMFDRGGAIALLGLLLYAWLAPDYFVDGDNAEFATLGTTGGIGHPSGYPLYILWLRATSWLPGSSAAHTTGLATALIAAIAIWVLHAACRAWGAKPAAASVACALVATAPVVLRMSTEAEVFALNDLIVALVLWLAAAEGPLRGVSRAGALGLVAGLGMSNHLTCMLVAPIGVYGIVLAVRERGLVVIAAALGGLVVGLTPYLYMFVAPDTRQAWTKVTTLGDVVRMFTRADYGGLTTFAESGERHGGDNEVALLGTIGRAFLWLPIAAAIYAFVVTIRARATRWAWLCVLVTALIAGPWLVSNFNLVTVGVSGYVVRRFHLLVLVVLALPVAVGLGLVATRVLAGRLDPHGKLAHPRAGDALALAVFVVAASLSLPGIARAHSFAVQRGVDNMLRNLPDNAAVITRFDDLFCGSNYLQIIDGVRPDVRVMTPTLDPIRLARYGLEPPARPVAEMTSPGIELAELLLQRGLPVFVDNRETDILSRFPHYPYGTLIRILPRGAKLPSIDEQRAMNEKLYERFVFDYEPPGASDDFPALAQLRYADPWTAIGQQYEAAGRLDEARKMYAIAFALAPADLVTEAPAPSPR